MILAQADVLVGNPGTLLVCGLMLLIVVLVPVAILRWIIRVNDIVRNQEEIIELLHKIADQHDH